MVINRVFWATVAVFAGTHISQAQTTPAETTPPATTSPAETAHSAPVFRLGVDDIVQVRVVDSEELTDKSVRVGTDGSIILPTVGRIQAAGRTVEELQGDIVQRLKRLLVAPDVSVNVTETHSQPVSVVGAVHTPGVFQLQGPKTLVEVLSLAGGPREDAGYMARITRHKENGALPLPTTVSDGTGLYWVADVNLQRIMDARNPAENILVMPNDIVNVPKADMVYVIGDVQKAGAIALGDQKTVTVLQAVSIASGLGKAAKSTEAKILRITPGSTTRTEVTVNIKAMLAGKSSDVALEPDDILFVPTSLKKDIGLKTLEALGGTGVTSMIYKLP